MSRMIYQEEGTAGDGFVRLDVYEYEGEYPFPNVTQIMVRVWLDKDRACDFDPVKRIIRQPGGYQGGDAQAIRRGIELFDAERKKLQSKGNYNLNLDEMGLLLNTLEYRLIGEGVDVDDLAGVKLESIFNDILKMAGGR